MKSKIITLALLVISSFAFAQTGFNYKALITDNGAVLASQSVTIKFTVLENGTATVYSETQNTNTDANGIVSVSLGEGTILSGDFTTIDWSNSQSLKIEINTGSGYQNFGTNPLKAVPLAKYADTAGNVFSGSFNDLTNLPVNLDIDTTDDVQQINDLSDGKTFGTSLFLGSDAGRNINNTNAKNIGVGWEALRNSTTGDENVAIGFYALRYNTTGSYNTANGFRALNSNTTGDNNTAIGLSALIFNTTGTKNTGIGSSALFFNNTNSGSTAVGYQAMYYADDRTTGRDTNNTAVGYESLKGSSTPSNNSGRNNTALGYHSLKSTTTGYDNTANGSLTLYANTTGFSNTANGKIALYSNTIGSANTANGKAALYSNTTGKSNSANGTFALFANTTGNNNTAIGLSALDFNQANSGSTAIGYKAMYYADSRTAGRITYNTAIGYESLKGSSSANNNTGRNNTALGYQSLKNNTSGYSNTANGSYALISNTTGYNNTANGKFALHNNTSGNYNTALGHNAYYSNSYSNSTALGDGSAVTASNQVRIGDAVTSIGGPVGWSSLSDGRFKTNVQENIPGLVFITKLRPVSYHFDTDKIDKASGLPADYLKEKRSKTGNAYGNIQFSGFIAQEVAQIAQEVGYDFSGIDKPKNSKDFYALRYAEFVVPLVKATQEQQEQIEELKKMNALLLKRIKALENKTN